MQTYEIKYNGITFEASEYQSAIFDEVTKGVNNIIISAAAGASKTTTIINAIDLLDDDKKVMFIAFNKEIVEDIRKKIKNQKSSIMTFHSLGFSILKENGIVNDNQINEYKYRNYIKSNIDTISSYKECNSLNNNKKYYINNIITLTDYCRYYLAFSIKEITKIAEKYGVTTYRDEIEVVREVLKWGKDNIDTIDYTDMIWLPNVMNLNTKRYIYDWIFIDEAQDTSIAEQELVMKCFKRGARFIAVGDDNQKINVWCGASEEAIDKFKEKGNVKEYKLPISYRCPKKIVELAKKYSDNIIAAPNAEDGVVKYDVSMYEPTNGDMVLCRTTAPLVDLHMKYNRLNKKSYIRGSENIKERYIDFIMSCNSKIIDRNCLTSNGLFPKMYERLFNEIERVKNAFGLDDDDSLTHQNVLRMYDDIEGIRVISEGIKEVDKLIEKIRIIFGGAEEDSIQLSTVHKAKGLEADNVYILLPSLMPSKMAKKDWEIKTEQNLIYVAITRARKSLNFMKDDSKSWYNKSGAFDINVMREELSAVRIKIKYNKENNIKEDAPIKTMAGILGKPKTIQDITVNSPIKPSKKAGMRLRNLMQ